MRDFSLLQTGPDSEGAHYGFRTECLGGVAVVREKQKGRLVAAPSLNASEMGYTRRVLKMSTIITISRTAPIAITTQTQVGVFGSGVGVGFGVGVGGGGAATV